MNPFIKVTVLSLFLSLATVALCDEIRPTPKLKQLMTAKQFETLGLGKLSPAELGRLETWLQSHYSGTRLQQSREKPIAGSPGVIESEIDGEFQGWDGDTIFKLMNGQIWQQSSYDYTYDYEYDPDVLIYKTPGGFKMKVGGVDESIYV